LGVRTPGGGLRPPVPSSVEPSGMPTRPTADADPIPVGDEADAAGAAAALPVVPAQVPDAVPMPPPSKTVLEPDMPENAVIGFPIPDDACGRILPLPEQLVVPVAGLNGDTPDVIGLTPGDASSVAPRGIPVGATGEDGPIPSGDVIPSGDRLLPPICAEAELLTNDAAKSAAVMTAVADRIVFAFLSFRIGVSLHCPESG